MDNEIAIFKEGEFEFEIPARMQTLRYRKFTQKEMAKLLDVSKTYISNLERGKTTIPARILLAYCRILGVSPNYMFGYEEEKSLIPEQYKLLSEDNRRLVDSLIAALANEQNNRRSL